MTPPFSTFPDLLRRPIGDPVLTELFGAALDQIDDQGNFAYLTMRDQGLELVFGPAARAIESDRITDPTILHLCAFHFHLAGHEGFAGFRGALPGDVMLGAPERHILLKLGEPEASGGGGVDQSEPGGRIPYWLRYRMGAALLRFHSDAAGTVQMATLMAPDIRLGALPVQHRLVVTSIPSRVSTLWRRERAKGAPLSEEEVTTICDEAVSIVLPLLAAAHIEEQRGYVDINSEHPWQEWCERRLDLAVASVSSGF